MVGFLLNLFRLFRAVAYALRKDEDFRSLLVLLVTLLAGATYFYWEVEGWSVVDSIYFSVMTMSTIGYGDLTPTTPLSKLFTVVFSILSIGTFAAVASKIVVAILARRHKKDKNRPHATEGDDDQM